LKAELDAASVSKARVGEDAVPAWVDENMKFKQAENTPSPRDFEHHVAHQPSDPFLSAGGGDGSGGQGDAAATGEGAGERRPAVSSRCSVVVLPPSPESLKTEKPPGVRENGRTGGVGGGDMGGATAGATAMGGATGGSGGGGDANDHGSRSAGAGETASGAGITSPRQPFSLFSMLSRLSSSKAADSKHDDEDGGECVVWCCGQG